VRGRAVLVRTDWDRHWRADAYFEGHPFITADAARMLAGEGATFVGIDSYNIDDTEDLSRPAHTVLLGAGIPICEHMCNLRSLPAGRLTFSAVPVKVSGFGTFPVRAFAATED
jgi:kynurenine formamidase